MIRPLSLLSTLRAACAAVLLLSALPAAAQAQGPASPSTQAKPTAEDAKKFVERVNADLKRLW